MIAQPRYQKGDTIGGRYQVHQTLMGGMGEVYLCLDLVENYPFALKTFQSRYLANPYIRDLFVSEVGAWVGLEKHPNIVRCYSMEKLDNQPFMVLEWVTGEQGKGANLRSWLQHGPLGISDALGIVIDICHGLIHAQTKQPGLVHRDLKPENILMAQGAVAKITDFGLASVVQQTGLKVLPDLNPSLRRQTMIGAGGVVGTPSYMAPEQWRGEQCNVRTDIYAVGCILYELLTWRSPYWAPTIDGLARLHMTAPPPVIPPRDGLPDVLNQILARCLAKDPDDRFADPLTLVDAVNELYHDQFGSRYCHTPSPAPFSAGDYLNRGASYAQVGRLEAAIADFDCAIELDPTHAVSYYNRGNTNAQLDRWATAIDDYTRAIELDPALAAAYAARGAAYAKLGLLEAAVADCNHAIILDATVAITYFNRGSVYDQIGRSKEALADYTRAIELDPSYADAYVSRGATYRDLDRLEEALADYTRAIELDPSYAGAYASRGVIRENLGRVEEALADYTRAIEFDPSAAIFYFSRGEVYHQMERLEEALADYTRAIELEPAFSSAVYYYRGTTYAQVDCLEEALADYTRAIELDPSAAIFYFSRGEVYHQMERVEEALADYTRAIELRPSVAIAYCSRGEVYHQMERLEEALADYTRAIVLEPTLASAYLNLGLILANDGRLVEALPYFEQAAQFGNGEAGEYVVFIRHQLGQGGASEVDSWQQACDAFEQATTRVELNRAISQFPFMTNADFREAITQAIASQVPAERRPTLEQRLAWLHEFASPQA